MKKIIYLIVCFFISLCLCAQDSLSHNENPTGLRAEGKIYVVMAVVLTILAGLIVYIIRLDRKITKLEKQP